MHKQFRHLHPSHMLVVLILLTLAACGSDGGPPSAQQLISNAQKAIQKVTSYHFNLTVVNPATGATLVIKSADGDILVPDKLKANASALVLGNVVQVEIITIGDKEYLTDPITGKWIPTTGLIDPRSLSDTKTGVAVILGAIQNPSTPSDSNIDGTPCWSIDGTLDAKYLAGITGGGVSPGSMVAITTCIGKNDNLPYQIRIKGIATQSDTATTTRTFKLSKFGENITITAPV